MPSWRHRDIFPSIQKAIERICQRKDRALHDEIVAELLKDPEACTMIDRALQQRPGYDRSSLAGEMIAWLSQKHTTRPAGLGEFSRRFSKRREGNKSYKQYTYYPIK